MTRAESASDRARAKLRSNPRVDCHLPVSIRLEGNYLCSAIIKDISVGGARLFVPGKDWLPHVFEVEADVFDRPITVCTMWEDGEYLGVEFRFHERK